MFAEFLLFWWARTDADAADLLTSDIDEEIKIRQLVKELQRSFFQSKMWSRTRY